MIVLRLAFLLALLTIAVAGVMYVTTRERRYLTFLFSVMRYTLYLLAGVAVFYILERLLLIA